ncbi:MAG: hypothetical protein AAF727_06200 [Pseudomonadota bacterium]
MHFFAFFALLLAFVFSPMDVAAQSAQRCMPLDVATVEFQRQHDEQVVWVGVDAQERQIVILGQSEGGTFTVFMVKDGVACGVAHGVSWAALSSEAEKPGGPVPPEEEG